MTFKKEIAFWGVPPPPIGGMTVHISRLAKFLNNKGWNSIFYNFTNCPRNDRGIVGVASPWRWYLQLLFSASPKVHYVISTRPWVRFLASILVLRGKSVIIRVGGESLSRSLQSGVSIDFFLNVMALKLCTAFIGVNTRITELASSYASASKVFHVPGFIPPPLDCMGEVPDNVKSFLNSGDHKIITIGEICDYGNEDTYGLWEILKTCRLLRTKFPSFKFRCLIVSYNISKDKPKVRKAFLDEIERLGLESIIMVYHSSMALWPILPLGDIFLRFTTNDGDSNALRESLFLGLRCIASDVVQRPEGVHVVSFDYLHLAESIFVVSKYEKQSVPQPNNAEKLSLILESAYCGNS